MKIQDLDTLETGLHASQRRSVWRRERARRSALRRRRARILFAVPALIGLAIGVYLCTRPMLSPREQLVLLLSFLLVVPFLSTFDIRL